MSVLDEAKAAVEGPRNDDYGAPFVNHGTTAKLVEAYLTRRYGNAHFDAQDVCEFNILQKVSRLANSPGHHDSLVDIAGYASNWESCAHVAAAMSETLASEFTGIARE